MSRGMWAKCARHRFAAFLVAVVALLLPAVVKAAPGRCPEHCCPADLDYDHPHGTVRLSVAIVGLYDIDDRADTWTADYWLYESWKPSPGFRPQTEIVNEVERISAQADSTWEANGRCERARHLRSRLYSPYDFRRFPFDRQTLELRLSDADFDANSMTYAAAPGRSGLDGMLTRQISGWRVSGPLAYSTEKHKFDWGDEGAVRYDYASFTLPVARKYGFHVAKFFLPLFVIVAVAFCSFWIDVDDLQSQVGIGVTCLLTAIAFQLAQASNLPEVDYLTLADRVYVVCYFVIALAMIESIYVNALARHDKRDRARRVDRICRWAFPAGLGIALAVATIVSVV